MKIENLKELRALVKEMRKSGIDAIKIDGIEFTLEPETKAVKSKVLGNPHTGSSIDTILDADTMTEDQLLFGSSDPTVWSGAN